MTNSFQLSFIFGIGQDNAGRNIPPSESHIALESIVRKAAELFGGYTLYDGEGGWESDLGLVQETSMTLMIVTPTADWHIKEQWARQLSDHIKGELNQAEVLVLKSSVERVQL